MAPCWQRSCAGAPHWCPDHASRVATAVAGSNDRWSRRPSEDSAGLSVVTTRNCGQQNKIGWGISADNHWLVTGSRDNTARLWPLQVNDLIDLARIRLTETLPLTNGRSIFPSSHIGRRFQIYPVHENLRKAFTCWPENNLGWRTSVQSCAPNR